MSEPRYFLHAGYVISQTDNQQHFISESQLIRLYGVDPKLCVRPGKGYREQPNDVHLYPKPSGNYTIPKGGAE